MKNPFLSLWLRVANQALATARGHMIKETRRQQGIMLRAMFQASGASPVKSKRSKSSRRRKCPPTSFE
jgi:hypothetical protein